MSTLQKWKYFRIWKALLCLTFTFPMESSYLLTLPGQETQGKSPFIILKNKIVWKDQENSSTSYKKCLFNPEICKHTRAEKASSTYQPLQGRLSNVSNANFPSQDLPHQPSNTSNPYLPSQDLAHKFSNASSAQRPTQDSIVRIFGNFSFGIGFSKKTGRIELLDSIDAQLSEHFYINVMVEGSLGGTELIVHSCLLLDRHNTSIGAYIIQEGCPSNTTAEEVMMGNSKKRIYSIQLSSVPTASEVFVACDVRLCKNLRRSQHCLLGCGSPFRISHSRSTVLETSLYRISAGPIRIIKGTSSRQYS